MQTSMVGESCLMILFKAGLDQGTDVALCDRHHSKILTRSLSLESRIVSDYRVT